MPDTQQALNNEEIKWQSWVSKPGFFFLPQISHFFMLFLNISDLKILKSELHMFLPLTN